MINIHKHNRERRREGEREGKKEKQINIHNFLLAKYLQLIGFGMFTFRREFVFL